MGVKIDAVGLRSSAASLSQRSFISFPLVLLLLPPELNPLLMASVRCHGNRQGWSVPPCRREPGWDVAAWAAGRHRRGWRPTCPEVAGPGTWRGVPVQHYSCVFDLLPHALGLSGVTSVGLCHTQERG